jgi:hypothetical protein
MGGVPVKYLIAWDDSDDKVEICDNGWREPEPGELNRLAAIIDIKPRAMTLLEVGTVVLGMIALTVMAVGMSGGGG